MTAYARLIRASLNDIEGQFVCRYIHRPLHAKLGIGQDRAKLKRGILKAGFLPGPFERKASQRLRLPALQCNKKVPTILLLPPEILKMVCGYLEPIWLFQAEAAYPEIAALSSSLNAVWYELLPPALFAEPEHFQDEARVSAVRSELSRGNPILKSNDRRYVFGEHTCC